MNNSHSRNQPAQTEQSYRLLIQNVKDYAIFMLDKTGKITSWDQGSVKLFGYKKNEIVGKKFSVLFTKEDARRGVPYSDMTTAAREGKRLDERQYLRKNKTKFWSSGVLTSTRDKKGTHQGFSKIMRDVTQQNDLHKTAVHNSHHDFLTGLPSRNFFEESLVESIPRTKKGKLLAILYMDFDNFKRVNDELGHRFGDLVLIEIAQRLTQTLRASDMAARLGGDEFVILMKGLKDEASVEHYAKRILQAFKIPIVIERKTIQTSLSVGISLYPNNAIKPAALLRFSDQALYKAKKSGGNQFVIYSK